MEVQLAGTALSNFIKLFNSFGIDKLPPNMFFVQPSLTEDSKGSSREARKLQAIKTVDELEDAKIAAESGMMIGDVGNFTQRELRDEINEFLAGDNLRLKSFPANTRLISTKNEATILKIFEGYSEVSFVVKDYANNQIVTKKAGGKSIKTVSDALNYIGGVLGGDSKAKYKLLAKSYLNDIQIDTDLKEVLKSGGREELYQTYEDNKKYVLLKVPKSAIDLIGKVYEEFKDMGGWYRELNKMAYDVLSESDGTLLLALIAVLSPKNPFDANFESAIDSYDAIKKDINSNRGPILSAFVDKFIDSTKNNFEYKFKSTVKVDNKTYRLANKIDRNKYIKYLASIEPKIDDLEVVDLITTKRTKEWNHVMGILKLIKYYMSNDNSISKQALIDLVSKYFHSSGDLEANYFIGKYKVFNFVLNLLDPDMEIAFDNMSIGWAPATIDTWMIHYFYGSLKASGDLSPEEFKTLVKNPTFSDYKKYTYLARIVQEQAAKLGTTPNELQAAIWMSVATTEGFGGKKPSDVVRGAIEKFEQQSDAYKDAIDILKKMESVLS